MARDKVELLVEIIGKDGITKLLDSAATEALRLERNMKRGEKSGNTLAKSVSKIRQNWSEVTVGLNAGIELFGKLYEGAQAVQEAVKETARARQVEKRFVDELSVSVEKLSAASGFQMSDLEIKKFALQAKNAGITMAQFEKILQVATKAAAGTGKEFADVFEGLFVDTIIGASDSYTEQLGIVFDLGVETENYARKNFIAKDKIDKTTQSSAALNVVLGKVGDKFKDIKVDDFTDELNKAQRRVKQLEDDLSKAATFLAVDVMDALGVTKTGQAAMDQFAVINKELEKYAAGGRKLLNVTAKGTDEVGVEVDVTADRVKHLRLELGRLARSSEDVKLLLFEDITKKAREQQMVVNFAAREWEYLRKEVLKVNEVYNDSPKILNAYDKSLINLSEQYGLADVAQKEFTTGAKMMASVFQKQIPSAMSEAIGMLGQFTAEARSSLSEFVTDPNFAKALAGDVDALMALFGMKRDKKAKKKPKRRRGAGARKKEPSESEINKRFAAVVKRYQRTTEAQQRYLPVAMTLREEMEALEAEASLGLTDAFGGEDSFQWMDSTEIRMVKLAEAMQSIASAANTMDAAFQQLGTSPGFANAIKQVGSMTEASLRFADTNDKNAQSYVDLTGAIVTGAGQAALGFIEGERERAGILAAMEFAHAGAALATGILTGAPNAFVASAIHLANAGLYTAIASGAGGGGSRGASAGGAGRGAGGAAGAQGARRIPQFGQMQPTTAMQPAQVVVNMSGAIVAGANRKKTANDLGDLVQESMAGRR